MPLDHAMPATPATPAADGGLAGLVRGLAEQEGCNPTPLPGVLIYRADETMPRMPVMYDPCALIVAQGAKRGYLGDQVLEYNASSYLVTSVPMPIEAEILEASPERPFLAVKLPIDPVAIGELQLSIEERAAPASAIPRGMAASPLTRELIDATRRLLLTFARPMDSRVLGPGILREIFYRVLLSEQGFALKAAARRKGQFHRIAGVLRAIHEDCRQPLDTAAMARMAGMSKSALHESFRAVTSLSPLQYIKTVRLHEARLMMQSSDIKASAAAYRVGYASASQFTREYKRLFGAPPSLDLKRSDAGVSGV